MCQFSFSSESSNSSILFGHVQWICSNHISDSTSRCPNTFFFRGFVCWRSALQGCERGGSKRPSSVMHFPFDTAAATESYFPAFLPLSTLFCVQLWNVLEKTQLIVKSFYVSSCFLSLYRDTERFRFVQGSHKAGASVQSDKQHVKVLAV